MLEYRDKAIGSREVLLPRQGIPGPMSVKGVAVTGWVQGAILDPPDEVTLYLCHNGTKATRTLEGPGIARNRMCRELGVFYRKDDVQNHSLSDEYVTRGWVNYILDRCRSIFSDVK